MLLQLGGCDHVDYRCGHRGAYFFFLFFLEDRSRKTSILPVCSVVSEQLLHVTQPLEQRRWP